MSYSLLKAVGLREGVSFIKKKKQLNQVEIK